MKKYQKLIKDNFDFIASAEADIRYAIDNDDENKIPVYIDSSVSMTLGALLVIKSVENYDFNNLDRVVANSFAKCLEAYARYCELGQNTVAKCFNLAEEIKKNTHDHLRKEILGS